MDYLDFFSRRKNNSFNIEVFHTLPDYDFNRLNSGPQPVHLNNYRNLDDHFRFNLFTAVNMDYWYQSGATFGNSNFEAGNYAIEAFIDRDGIFQGGIGRNVFWKQFNLKVIHLPNVTSFQIALFGGDTDNVEHFEMRTLRMPSVTSIGPRALFIVNSHEIRRMYFPRLASSQFGFSRFQNLNQITYYVNKNLDIPENDGFFSNFQSVVFINETDIQEIPACQSISLSNITSNSVQLTITDSALTYPFPIDFYEIYAFDGSTLSRYYVHQDFDTNTGTVTNLEPNKNYKILVRVADTKYNLSNWTESQEFTTLNI